MKKFLFTALILCIISPVFAEDIIFTNKDLLIYSDDYRMDKKDAGRENNNNESIDRGEGQPRTLSGDSCDVLDFSSQETSHAVHNPDYDISGTITKQTVTVRIKSKRHIPLLVKNFYISVFLEDGTNQTKPLEPAPGDSQESMIQPDTEYVGYVAIDGNLPVVSVGKLLSTTS